jgi:hypothetical protein
MVDVVDARIALMNTKIRNIQKTMRLIVWSLIPVMILTLGLAWIFYPEPYGFIDEYISNLGNILSYDADLPNTTSMLIMTVGFSITGFVCLIVAVLYFVRPGMRIKVIKKQDSDIRILKSEPGLLYAYLKGFLYLLMFVGALGIAIPGDHSTLAALHKIGASIFIAGLGIVNFVHQALRFIRKVKRKDEKKKIDFYFDMVLVALVFFVIIMLGITYLLRHYASISHPAVNPFLWQKLVLIVNLVAIFFLDIDDM